MLLCVFQVVTLVLYTYFIAALLGRQMIPKDANTLPSGLKYEDPDLYFPLFTALQVTILCLHIKPVCLVRVDIRLFSREANAIQPCRT